MEASSPLAAIHRPAVQSFGRPDIFRSRGSNPFNGEPRSSGTLFRDRIMAKGKPDYFSDKGVHSSSPSGSLSADLSQNFCIDNEASPQLTPRRALFTTSTTKDALEGQDFQANSPLPATSSPAAPNVDASPVRLQKTPCVKEVVIASPTPVADAERDEVLLLLESPVPSGRRSSGDGLKRLVDRRKQNLRRPSLARTKGYSTSSITSRWYSASSTSGSKSNKDELPRSPSLNLSLGDCFQDSPPQERRSISFNSPSSGNSGSVRVNRTLFTSLSNASKRSASPLAASPSRRTSNPIRPRKQYRRSLSMFEKSVDVIQPKESAKLQAVVDIEEPAELLLPHFFPAGQNDSIPRLSKATFLDILDGKHNEHYDNKLIIDCRFEYEFSGGHVSGAVNYNDKEALAAKLFPNPPELTGRTLLVFHCEYSAHRAPLMARHIRSEDRAINVENYPRLTYPEVYILDGGYSSFFTENRERCEPQAYVEMDAAEHAKTCEEELDRLRKPRKGLSRAKTYAFGQKSSVVGCDSPTATCKYSLDDSPLQISESPSLFLDKSHTKRMASY